jgi:hypothetical protein
VNVIVVLFALTTVMAAGWGVQSLLGSHLPHFSLGEQVGLSWLLGSGVVSLGIWSLGLVIQAPLLPISVTAICISLTIAGWRRVNHFQQRPRAIGGSSKCSGLAKNPSAAMQRAGCNHVEITLGVLLAAQIAIIFYLSFIHTLGWDGLLNWEIKARYAFENGGGLPRAYFHSGREFSHPEYPLTIPFSELWLYFWLGEANQFWAKIIFPCYYLAGVLLLVGFAARLSQRRYAAMVAAGLLFFVPQISVASGSAIVGYADFPISVFYLATIGLLIRAFTEDNSSLFYLYAVCLALLPWVKHEGLILWLVAAGCGAITFLRRKKPARYYLLLLPGLLIMAAWHTYLKAQQLSSSTEFLPFNLHTLLVHLNRIGPIFAAVANEFISADSWGLLWLLVAFACICLLRRPGDFRVTLLLIALVLPIVLYASVYVFSGWPEYLVHVTVSISRLLMHVVPLGLLIAAFGFSPLRSRPATCARRQSERAAGVEFA